MKNTPFSLIITNSSNRLLVTDKSGRTVFFPWGPNKQGYYIKKVIASKVIKFYKNSYPICLVLLITTLSLWGNSFWGIVISIALCFGGLYLAHFLYFSRVVKSLSPARASYKELILAKYESDDSDSEDLQEQTETKFPAQWSKPIAQTNNEPFLGVKRIWYRLSPGQLFALFIFLGGGIIMVSANFIKHEFGESPIDFLIAFVVSVLWGFAGFVVVQNMDGDKKDW